MTVERIPPPLPLRLWPETTLLSLVALFLCRSPLTGAFAYEFSFALGIASYLTAAVGTSLRLQHLGRRRPLTDGDRFRLPLAHLGSLAGPLLVVHLCSLRIPTCRWGVGWAWFLLLPVASSLFGSASGIFATRRRRTPLATFLWALAPGFLFTLWTLADLYAGPSLSFLNPALGFFAGPIYDEWIPIGLPVVTFRLWTVAASFCLVWFSVGSAPRTTRIVVSLIVLSPLGFRGALGWHQGSAALERELPHAIEGVNVLLRYAPGSLSRPAAEEVRRLLEERAEKIAAEISLAPEELRKPVSVYLYPDPVVKKRLTGTRHTAVGNPVTRSVHALASDPPWLLGHELAHAMAAPIGIPGLGLPSRIGLLEGFATATEGYRDDLSLHEWARAMRDLSLLPSIRALMEPAGFWAEAPTRAYLAAGSFCRWLLDTRGAAPFRNLYRGSSFEAAYGRSLERLVGDWERFLATVPLTPSAVRIAEPALRSRPIAQRRCPHDVAAATEAGYACWTRKDLPGAISSFETAWRYSGGLPSTTLRLARAEVRGGNWERVASLAEEVLNRRDSSTADRANARLLLGDSRAAAGDLRGAIEEYARPLQEDLEEDLRLAIRTRLELAWASLAPLLEELISTGPERSWAEKLLESRETERLPNTCLFAAKRMIAAGNRVMARRFLERSVAADGWDIPRLKVATQVEAFPWLYEEILRRSETEGLRILAREHLSRLSRTSPSDSDSTP